MESVQFGSEVSDIQEELVRLNLKILSMIESFVIIETQADMDRLNGEIRLKLDLMRKGVENLRTLARHQVNSDSAVMLKADANSHEDQMTGCHLAFKKANIACMSRLYAKGKENLMSKVRSLTYLFFIVYLITFCTIKQTCTKLQVFVCNIIFGILTCFDSTIFLEMNNSAGCLFKN